MSDKKPPRIRDIASRAGVAPSTVSHVLNGTAPISHEVGIESRTQITQDAIGQLERGYSLDGDLLFGNADGALYIWPRVIPEPMD